MSAKRRPIQMTVEFKRRIIKTVEENPAVKKGHIANAFGIKSTTLHTIMKNKEKYEEGGLDDNCVRAKKAGFVDVEDCLASWLQTCRDSSVPLRGADIRKKAQEFAKQLGHEEFRASNGWLHNFKRRRKVVLERGTRQVVKVTPAASHEPTAVEREAALVRDMVRVMVRERCPWEPDLRPTEVLQEAMAACGVSEECRGYLLSQLDNIRRDVQRTRLRAVVDFQMMHLKDRIVKRPGLRINTLVFHINDGFYYGKHRQDEGRIYLRCIKRDVCDCRASMPLSEDAQTVDNFVVCGFHNHMPDFKFLKILELKEAIFKRCREEETDYKTIFNEVSARYPKDVSSQISFITYASSMRRQRINERLKEKIHLRLNGEEEGEPSKRPLKRKSSQDGDKKKRPYNRRKTSDNAATSSGSHPPESLGSDTELTSNKDTKPSIDELKGELMLEDYGNSDDALGETCFEELQSNNDTIEGSSAYPPPCEDSPDPFETVVCDSGVQVKQEIIEDETGSSELSHVPEAGSTSLMLNDPVGTNATSSAYLENTEQIESLNVLARFTNTLSSMSNPSQEAGTLVHIPTCVQTVTQSQPLVMATTTPGYVGLIMSDSYTVTNYSAATATNYNMAASTNFSSAITPNNGPGVVPPSSFTNLPAMNTTIAPVISTNVTPSVSGTNPPPISVTNAPGQPPRDKPSCRKCSCEDLEGVFISLKKVPMKRRKKTTEKLIRLVKLISDLDLEPDEVSFSVTTK